MLRKGRRQEEQRIIHKYLYKQFKSISIEYIKWSERQN